MTIMTLEEIKPRLKAAHRLSPLAVFTCNKKGKLDVKFADTVHTRARIAHNDEALVGVYHRDNEISVVMSELRAAAKGGGNPAPSDKYATHSSNAL